MQSTLLGIHHFYLIAIIEVTDIFLKPTLASEHVELVKFLLKYSNVNKFAVYNCYIFINSPLETSRKIILEHIAKIFT